MRWATVFGASNFIKTHHFEHKKKALAASDDACETSASESFS
jgi:hypothetical protein